EPMDQMDLKLEKSQHRNALNIAEHLISLSRQPEFSVLSLEFWNRAAIFWIRHLQLVVSGGAVFPRLEDITALTRLLADISPGELVNVVTVVCPAYRAERSLQTGNIHFIMKEKDGKKGVTGEIGLVGESVAINGPAVIQNLSA